jgi:hypothetical protein
LRRRIDDAHHAKKSLQADARARAAPLFAPIADEMTDNARIAARAIVDVWAALNAVERATGNTTARSVAASLDEAVAALLDHNGLLARENRAAIEVPPQTIDLLKGLRDKGEVLSTGLPLQIGRPYARPQFVNVAG